uniref:ERBB receptor feedback inhibitor 1 n=1 Tax=Nothobranchius kuhntae TaxID=321403 RepID=A0A1A8JCM9_NOTKU
MDGNQSSYWGQQSMSRLSFGLSSDVDHNPREHHHHHQQQQQTAKEFTSSIPYPLLPFFSDHHHVTSENSLQPSEGDQVVPSSHRREVFGGHQKEAKPLPPLPDPEEFMSDEAADNEVEFFTSDRQRLLPKSCPKVICRGGSSNYGQVNYGYKESSLLNRGAGISSMAFSWPSREDRGPLDGGSRCGVEPPSFANFGDDDQQSRNAGFGSKCTEQHQSSAIRFSCTGFPSQTHRSFTAWPTEKPQVPPRIPIPSKPSPLSKVVSASEEDKPPKIPPRVPLVPPCPPRTPSPKTLPIYINGVMPVTQSFAANPNYVSKALQRQQRERAPPPSHISPCIVPILKDGKQASATHYILLPPGRTARSERRERFLSEPNRTGSTRVWQK